MVCGRSVQSIERNTQLMPQAFTAAGPDTADPFDHVVTRLLLTGSDLVLPPEWNGTLVGVTPEQALTIHHKLDPVNAACFAATLRDSAALAVIEADESRAAVRQALMGNPHLSPETAAALLKAYGKGTHHREQALRRMAAELRMSAAAANAELWISPSAALARAVAEHPAGPEAALTIAEAAGPRFAALALASALTVRKWLLIPWTAVHRIVTSLDVYDAELDTRLGAANYCDHRSPGYRTSISGTAEEFATWRDITWSRTRGAVIGYLHQFRASGYPGIREAADGLLHGPLTAVAPPSSWWHNRLMTGDDLQALIDIRAVQGICEPIKQYQIGCDSSAIRALHDRFPELAPAAIVASWKNLSTADRISLLRDPDIGNLAWQQGLTPYGSANGPALLALIAAGLDVTEVEAAWLCQPHLKVAFEKGDETHLATAPADLLRLPFVTMPGKLWAAVLSARPGDTDDGALIGNALAASYYDQGDLDVVVAMLGRLDLQQCRRALRRRIWRDGGHTKYRCIGQMEKYLDAGHAVIREAMIEEIVPLICAGVVGPHLSQLCRRLPLDWGKALSAESPAAQVAVADICAEAFAGDSEGLNTFKEGLMRWRGTLDELVETALTL